jgi:hypothetical protein
MVGGGNFPPLHRHQTASSRAASAAAKMKPRASCQRQDRPACCPAMSVSAQITVSNAVPSASSGTMS